MNKKLLPFYDREGDLAYRPINVNDLVWQTSLAKWKYGPDIGGENSCLDRELSCPFCSLYLQNSTSCSELCPIRLNSETCNGPHHPWRLWRWMPSRDTQKVVYDLIEKRYKEWKVGH
jgi:hypothetical protein